MHWPTHIFIADIIHKKINSLLGISLNSKAFMVGSIKPDFSPRLLKIKHLKHISLEEVGLMIENLVRREIPSGGRQLLNYSVDLGVIMHYITDFFSYAHNHPKYVNKIRHIKYEWAIAFEYLNVDIDNIFNRAKEKLNIYNCKQYASIKDYIDKIHNQYMDEHPSVQNDVRYSLEMCLTIAFMIVNSSISSISGSTA